MPECPLDHLFAALSLSTFASVSCGFLSASSSQPSQHRNTGCGDGALLFEQPVVIKPTHNTLDIVRRNIINLLGKTVLIARVRESFVRRAVRLLVTDNRYRRRRCFSARMLAAMRDLSEVSR